jgi:hypothetical protein
LLLAIVATSCGADAPTSTRPEDATAGTTIDQVEATEETSTPVATTDVDPAPSVGDSVTSPSSWRKVAPEVVATLETDGSVPVLISLDADDDPERIDAVQQQVLDRVGESGLRVRIAFEGIPAIAATVTTIDALTALERDPGVVVVALDAGGGGDGGG